MMIANITFCFLVYLWIGSIVIDWFFNEVSVEKKCAIVLFYPIVILIKGIKGLIEIIEE